MAGADEEDEPVQHPRINIAHAIDEGAWLQETEVDGVDGVGDHHQSIGFRDAGKKKVCWRTHVRVIQDEHVHNAEDRVDQDKSKDDIPVIRFIFFRRHL